MWTGTPERLKLPKIKHGETLRIEAYGPDDLNAAANLLACIVLQSMSDGMTGFSLGVNREKGESWMVYRRRDAAGGPAQEWSMTPPRIEQYPCLLQAALKYTCLQPTMPLVGHLRVATPAGPMELRFSSEQLDSFSVSWDAPLTAVVG